MLPFCLFIGRIRDITQLFLKIFRIIFVLLIFTTVIFGGREEDFNFALKLYKDGYYDLAAEQLSQFVESYPDDARIPQAYFMQGNAYYQIEKWRESNAAFLRVALQYPDSRYAPEAMFLSAQCLKNMGKWQEAARSFAAVFDYYPQSEFAAKGIAESGMIHRFMNQPEKAAASFQRILQRYPGTASASLAYFQLGGIAEESGDLSKALEYYRLSVKSADDDALAAQAHILCALILNKQGNWDAAEQELLAVLSPPVYSQYAKLLSAQCQRQRGDFISADSLVNLVMKQAAADSIIFMARIIAGDNHYIRGQFEDALESYQSIPPNDSLKLRLGLVYLKLDSLDRAVRYFSEVIAGESNDANRTSALNELIAVYQRSEMRIDLSALFRKLLPNITGIEGWMWYASALGEITFNTGDYVTSRRYFESLAEKTTPFSDDCSYYLGRIAEIGQITSKAFQYYRSLLRDFPGSEYCPEAAKRIDWLSKFIPAENLMEKIAALSAQSQDFPNKGVLALNWGLCYYNDFKNYQKAAEQFSSALQTGWLSKTEGEQARRLLIECYMTLAHDNPAMEDSLRSANNLYLRSHPDGQSAQSFELRQIRSEYSASDQSRNSALEYAGKLRSLLDKYPQGDAEDEILAQSAQIYINSLKNYETGIRYADTLLNEFPESGFSEEILITRAGAEFVSGDTVSAAEDYRLYMKNYPKGFHIAGANMGLYETEFDNSEKIKILESIIERYYYHSVIPELRENLADLYSQSDQYDKALALYRQLLELSQYPRQYQGSDELLFKIALVYRKTGEFNSAREYLLEYIISQPAGAYLEQALLTLGELSEADDSAPAALRFYQNLISRGSDSGFDILAMERMAGIYYRIGRYSEGQRIFGMLAEQTNDESSVMKYQAQVIVGYYRQGLLNKAHEEAVNFAKLHRKNEKLEHYQAQFYLEKGKYTASEKNYDQALDAFETITKKYKKTEFVIEAEYETAKIYLLTKKVEKALETLNGIIEKYPINPLLSSVYLTLGAHYYRQGQTQSALLNFQKVLQDSNAVSLWPAAMQNLSITYKDLGLYQAALSTTLKYIEMFPNRNDILQKKFDAALMHLSMKEYDRALKLLDELLASAEGEFKAEVQYYIGEAYFEKGDFAQASLEYMKARYLDPQGGLDWAVTAIYKAAQGYEKLGKYHEAAKLYREIIKSYGENSDFGKGAKAQLDAISDKIDR